MIIVTICNRVYEEIESENFENNEVPVSFIHGAVEKTLLDYTQMSVDRTKNIETISLILYILWTKCMKKVNPLCI